jgi:hypothetical protein
MLLMLKLAIFFASGRIELKWRSDRAQPEAWPIRQARGGSIGREES